MAIKFNKNRLEVDDWYYLYNYLYHHHPDDPRPDGWSFVAVYGKCRHCQQAPTEDILVILEFLKYVHKDY